MELWVGLQLGSGGSFIKSAIRQPGVLLGGDWIRDPLDPITRYIIGWSPWKVVATRHWLEKVRHEGMLLEGTSLPWLLSQFFSSLVLCTEQSVLWYVASLQCYTFPLPQCTVSPKQWILLTLHWTQKLKEPFPSITDFLRYCVPTARKVTNTEPSLYFQSPSVWIIHYFVVARASYRSRHS